MKYPVNDRVVLMWPPEGPLAGLIRSYSAWIVDQGYRLASLRERVRMAADLSRWLGRQAVRASDIQTEHFAQYLRYRRRRGKRVHGAAAALAQLRDYLRAEGVIAPERIVSSSPTAAQRCAQEFERYLREERLLAPATIVNYVPFISRFLEERFGTASVDLSQLCAGDIVRFVQRQAPRLQSNERSC